MRQLEQDQKISLYWKFLSDGSRLLTFITSIDEMYVYCPSPWTYFHSMTLSLVVLMSSFFKASVAFLTLTSGICRLPHVSKFCLHHSCILVFCIRCSITRWTGTSCLFKSLLLNKQEPFVSEPFENDHGKYCLWAWSTLLKGFHCLQHQHYFD